MERILYWIKAARPRTLPASVAPVAVGCGLALRDGCFRLPEALLCFIVAVAAQVASNFANDYFDFRKGGDTSARVGPVRAVASGRISARAMLAGTLTALAIACVCGLLLSATAGWELILVGLGIAACVLAYSTLAYRGLGDICVLLFYGIIPVCFTYYVQAGHFALASLPLSVAVGLLSVNILVVNNYRDYAEDSVVGKRTTIVRFGRRFGRRLYLANGIAAMLLTLPFLIHSPLWLIPFHVGFAALHLATYHQLSRSEGRALNRTLGHTARNVFLFAVLIVLALALR